jgi:hypothetical protein
VASSKSDIYAHWRDSALVPRFFSVDARASFVVLLCLVRPNWYTFGAVVAIITFLSILNYYRISLVAAGRLLRNFLTGSTKIILRRK